MLTSKERALLRGRAQHIRASFQIGASELHQNNIQAISDTFNTKELIKIKVNRINKTDKDITKKFAAEIAQKVDAEVVGIIGTTIILYKQHQNPELRMDLHG